MLDIGLPNVEDISFLTNNMVDRMANLIQCKTASHVVNMVLQKEREQRRINNVTQIVAVDVVKSLLRTAGTIDDDIPNEQELGGGDGVIRQQQSVEDMSVQIKQEIGAGDAGMELQSGQDLTEELPRYMDAGDARRIDAQTSEDLHEEFPANMNASSSSRTDHSTPHSPRPSEHLSAESAQDMSGGDARPSTSRTTTWSHEELEERMSWRLQKLAQFENEQNELPSGDEERRKKKPQTWTEFARELQSKRSSQS